MLLCSVCCTLLCRDAGEKQLYQTSFQTCQDTLGCSQSTILYQKWSNKSAMAYNLPSLLQTLMIGILSYRQIDRQTDKQADRPKMRYTDLPQWWHLVTYYRWLKCENWLFALLRDYSTNRTTNRQTYRQTDGQAGRQSDR